MGTKEIPEAPPSAQLSAKAKSFYQEGRDEARP